MIEYHDLLGTPYEPEDRDCSWLAWEIVRRAGGEPLFEPEDIRGGGPDELEMLLQAFADRWEMVGMGVDSATQDGDLVLTSGPEGLHLLPVVDGREGLLLTTTLKSCGVIAVRRRAVQNCIGVYRRKTPC